MDFVRISGFGGWNRSPIAAACEVVAVVGAHFWVPHAKGFQNWRAGALKSAGRPSNEGVKVRYFFELARQSKIGHQLRDVPRGQRRTFLQLWRLSRHWSRMGSSFTPWGRGSSHRLSSSEFSKCDNVSATLLYDFNYIFGTAMYHIL